MASVVRSLFVMWFQTCGPLCFSFSTISVDDSYTPSERFFRYQKQDASLKWPALSFADGQQVYFDRRYKVIDKRELHLDIFMPVVKSINQQTIVMIHGGGWRSGNRSNLYAMANQLAQR